MLSCAYACLWRAASSLCGGVFRGTFAVYGIKAGNLLV